MLETQTLAIMVNLNIFKTKNSYSKIFKNFKQILENRKNLKVRMKKI